MGHEEALEHFKAGLQLLRSDYAGKSLPHFKKALALDDNNPFYLSYFGLSLAAAERKWDEAESACLSALRMKRTQAELYLNLAQVYLLAGRKEEAAETLTSGLRFTKKDPRLAAALRKLNTRRQAILPFLPRTSAVNRGLGKLRHRVMKSLTKEA